MKSLALCILLLLGNQSIGQLTHEIDLGRISKKNEDVVDLIIHNPYQQRIFLKDYTIQDQMRLQKRRDFIEPGRAEVFRLKINPGEDGQFNKELQLQFSPPEIVIQVIVSGKASKSATNHLQDCPSFDDLPSKRELIRKQRKIAGNIHAEMIYLKDLNSEIEKLSKVTYKPNNLTFLLDISSSMKRDGKIELLKESMTELILPLRDQDKLSLVVYDTKATLLMEQIPVKNADSLIAMVQGLEAKGSTNAIDGIDIACKIADAGFISGGNNQIYLVSDGGFDLEYQTLKDLKEIAGSGVRVSTLAIKSSKNARRSLKKLSTIGNGKLVRIDHPSDKKKILDDVKRMSSY